MGKVGYLNASWAEKCRQHAEYSEMRAAECELEGDIKNADEFRKMAKNFYAEAAAHAAMGREKKELN